MKREYYTAGFSTGIQLCVARNFKEAIKKRKLKINKNVSKV